MTSAFFRYSALEYFIQLLKVLFIDALLFKMFAPLRETKAVLRHTAELNFIVHPILFFVTPFLYSHSKFNIGIALATNALIYAVAKWYFMRRFMLFSKRYSWSIPILSLLAAWYSGAILSF